MVCGSHPKIRAMYSTPPCPSLAASTAAYRRRSFSDSHPKNRCIFCSTSAVYPSMPHSLIQNLLRGKDTTASVSREVILDHILRCCEPLRGWRHVRVTARRTRQDWAECIRELADVSYPQATRIRLVLDNLNTHTGASLYETFQPKEARRLLDRLAFHYIPKHASLLN